MDSKPTCRIKNRLQPHPWLLWLRKRKMEKIMSVSEIVRARTRRWRLNKLTAPSLFPRSTMVLNIPRARITWGMQSFFNLLIGCKELVDHCGKGLLTLLECYLEDDLPLSRR